MNGQPYAHRPDYLRGASSTFPLTPSTTNSSTNSTSMSASTSNPSAMSVPLASPSQYDAGSVPAPSPMAMESSPLQPMGQGAPSHASHYFAPQSHQQQTSSYVSSTPLQSQRMPIARSEEQQRSESSSQASTQTHALLGQRGGQNGGLPETAPYLQDFSLVAEAAKRAEMACLARDLDDFGM